MTITLTREEAQQVLDALEAEHSAIYGTDKTVKAIETLRARLAQPEPKPACWLYKGEVRLSPSDLPPEETIALYTAPPQREWHGLTDEEIRERWFSAEPTPDGRSMSYNYARAIEAKLKEKNT